MKKIIIVLFWCLYSCLAQAEMQVEVDSNQVVLGDTFKLIITDDEPQNGSVPDLTPLQKDFAIYSTERNVNYTVINGQAQSVSQWIIALKPLKAGILTIPSIKMGLQQSQPIVLDVKTTSAALKNSTSTQAKQQKDVILTVEADEKAPYVNQQIIYTVKLFNSKRLLDAGYHPPKVEDALLIPLGDAKRYQKVLNSIPYAVEEQRYAIFPQKSGTLSIESPIFTALVYDFDPQRVSVQDKTLKLTIKPIPSQYRGKTWLPAQQVSLNETYENSSQVLAQGSTLTRVITLESVGTPAQLLPNLSFEDSDVFNVYPEKGKETNKIIQGELVSRVEYKVTYLFNKPGKTTIPALKLHWFNTKIGQDEIATLAPKSFDITATTATHPKEDSSTPATQVVSSEVELPSPANDHYAWSFALFFAVAWVITLGLWMSQKKFKSRGKKQEKKILNELNKACKAGNACKARDALLQWAAIQWPDATLLNLTDLSLLVRDVGFKKQIHKLSQALYKNNDDEIWSGNELFSVVIAMKPGNYVEKQSINGLPPINPIT